MAKGLTSAGEPIDIVPIFKRQVKGKTGYFARIETWVADYRLAEVDEALKVLKAHYTGHSLSRIVCTAIVAHAKQVRRKPRTTEQG